MPAAELTEQFIDQKPRNFMPFRVKAGKTRLRKNVACIILKHLTRVAESPPAKVTDRQNPAARRAVDR